MPLGPPKTVAESGKDSMLSGGGLAPSPIKSAQSGAQGVKCGQCGHYHRGGNICSYNKSFDGILELFKGNPYHEPKGSPNGGRFAKKPFDLTDTTSVDTPEFEKPAGGPLGPAKITESPVVHSGGQGPGDGKDDGKPDDTDDISTSEGNMSDTDFKATKQQKVSKPPTGTKTEAGTVASKVGGKKSPVNIGPDPLQPSDNPVKDAVDAAVADAESIGMNQKMGRQGVHEAAIEAAMKQSPEKFEGGPMTPRKDRTRQKREPGEPSRQGTGAHDPWTEASKQANLSAQRDAAEKVRQGGGDSLDQAMAGQAAWMESDNAYKEAMESAMDPASVPGNTKQLAAKWKQRQSGIEGIMPSATQPSPPPTTTPPTTTPAAPTQQNVPGPDGGTQQAMATPESQSPSDTSTYDRLVTEEKYGKVFDRASKQGFTPEEAHQAASQATEGHAPVEGWQSPNQRSAAAKEEKQATKDVAATEKQATKDTAGNLKEQARMDAFQNKPQGSFLNGNPFSQMYSAGAGMGSSMTQESGGAGPVAAFAAQRTHQLLNPNLRKETAPAFAGTGTGARTKDRHAGGTTSAIPTGQGAIKSIETLLGM